MSKILIGVPTCKAHKYCFEEFSEALRGQSITADIIFVVNNGQESYARWIKSQGFSAAENPKPAKEGRDHVLNNRNYIRDYFLGLDYDYLLLLSSDVILPGNALEMLLCEKKDIIAAPYLNIFQLGEPVVAPKMFKDVDGGAQLFTYKGMFPARVEEIGAAGLGCVLLSRKSLEETKFNKMENGVSDDIQFYIDAKKRFKLYGHTGVRCTHRVHPAGHEMNAHFEWRTNYEPNVFDVELRQK